ncbi:DUF1702 family protein [Dactylosporangium sp. CS-047395]|uniref:DUF1702 family protein n=1 Tax=Dactylosporangium sp. CS-047395 TaxID=3239936 RepID=UPI003D91B26B
MTVFGKLRRALLTPNVKETTMAVRGFHVKNDTGRDLLETVGKSFLDGFAEAAEARTVQDVVAPLADVPVRFRGFAYEGAGMAFAIRDATGLGRGLTRAFLEGPGQPHIYMAYVGVGWAMARLPRPLWRGLYAPDPLLRWLVLDGYGFHQAYFQTSRYVFEQYRHTNFPWPSGGPGWYADRVIDQGVGRAMWFVGGADPQLVARMIDRFAEDRRADLYAGAGLAATYAGAAGEDELRDFRERAGQYRPELAQGCAFAAAARVKADLLMPHNSLATQVFCGTTPQEASDITDVTLEQPGTAPAGTTVRPGTPEYELWRQRIAGQFVALGRC